MRRLGAVLLMAAFFLLHGAPSASAHPLGNFTVNTYHGLVVTPDAVRVDVVVDFAEIPAIRVRQDADADRSGTVSAAEGEGYAARECAALPASMSVRVADVAVPLVAGAGGLAFPPGAAGLVTARLSCVVTATVATFGRAVAFETRAYVDRIGWREVVAVGGGVALADSTVPETSPSAVLTAYPEDLLSSPVDQRAATFRVVEGAGTGAGLLPDGLTRAPGVDRLTGAFQRLAARESLNGGFVALALLVCVGLGAAHAFAPGHGKTVMAAYLVGRGGHLRHAVALGASVTATHTLGVLLLGAALSTATILAPERLYAVLGLASGVLVLVIGAGLLARATGLRARLAHARAHRHAAEHHHDHAGHDHDHHADAGAHTHGGRAHSHDVPDRPGLRGVLALGFAGGLVPSPSALVVLLGAIALNRAWFGVLLVAAYGAGMALALVGVGLVLVRTRGSFQRWAGRRSGRLGRGALRTASALPVLTAAIVVVVGLGLTLQAAAQV